MDAVPIWGWLAGALVLALLGLGAWRIEDTWRRTERHLLEKGGHRTTGHVTEVWCDGQNFWQVTYQFMPTNSGTPIQRTAEIGKFPPEVPKVGAEVEVIFEAIPPFASQLARYEPQKFAF